MKRSAYSQEHFTTIVYPKFGGQTERITGGWKIKTTRLELKVFQTKPTDLIIGVKLLPFFYENKTKPRHSIYLAHQVGKCARIRTNLLDS